MWSLDSAFYHSRSKVEPHSTEFCSKLNVEPHSTALYVVPVRMSSHSTALNALPVRMSVHTLQRFPFIQGRMSSRTRQHIPLFQVECRGTLDIAFRCSRSNVESHSTALVFQGEYRVILDRAFRPFRSNVESYATALSDLPGRMSSRTRQRFPVLSAKVESHTSALNAFQG